MATEITTAELGARLPCGGCQRPMRLLCTHGTQVCDDCQIVRTALVNQRNAERVLADAAFRSGLVPLWRV